MGKRGENKNHETTNGWMVAGATRLGLQFLDGLDFLCLHSLKLTANTSENRPGPKRKRNSIPSIHFKDANC